MPHQTLARALTEHPFARDFDSSQIESLAECGRNCTLAAGEYLWRQGQRGDHCYLIRSGEVALEIHIPHQGPLRIETVGPGEVLGWSWLVPPYRWQFDARALSPVLAFVLDGDCLRKKLESDPGLGYQVLKRFTPIIAERLQATRLRLIEHCTVTAGG